MKTKVFLMGALLGSAVLVSGCIENQNARVATGAVVGGVIGNQFGSGSGNTIATIGGAAAGAAIASNRTP